MCRGSTRSDEFRLKLLEGVLPRLHLCLCRSARPLHLVIRLQELLHRAVQIRRVEPDRTEEEYEVKDERKKPAPHRATTHFVQQSIILERQAMYLFEERLMWGWHNWQL